METCGHTPVWPGERTERTNARGRHRYCAPFKAWMVEQALSPGMSTAGLAMRNQVNANQLRRWVLLHRAREATASVPAAKLQRLLPVNVVPGSPPSGMPIQSKSDSAIEINSAASSFGCVTAQTPRRCAPCLTRCAGRLDDRPAGQHARVDCGRPYQATSGSVSLTAAQLSMLLEGIDWRMPVRTHEDAHRIERQPELAA